MKANDEIKIESDYEKITIINQFNYKLQDQVDLEKLINLLVNIIYKKIITYDNLYIFSKLLDQDANNKLQE